MFVDSHCHLSFPDLSHDLDGVIVRMKNAGVTAALSVCTRLNEAAAILATAHRFDCLFASVGVHPDTTDEDQSNPSVAAEPDMQTLLRLADDAKVVAIGETGLDYFRLPEPLQWQRDRFKVHIRAAKASRKPLIIHTRNAAADTLRIMGEEGAAEVGGVMHCFTETAEVAAAALAMGFYISFSGIVTFKNAQALREVAAMVPIDRLLIETDSPYLAPVPLRGKRNEPANVVHVAQCLAQVRGTDIETIAMHTSKNFETLFLNRRT